MAKVVQGNSLKITYAQYIYGFLYYAREKLKWEECDVQDFRSMLDQGDYPAQAYESVMENIQICESFDGYGDEIYEEAVEEVDFEELAECHRAASLRG